MQTAKLSLDRRHWGRRSEKLTDYGDAPETLCHHPPPYWRRDSNRLIVERDPHAFVNAWYVKKKLLYETAVEKRALSAAQGNVWIYCCMKQATAKRKNYCTLQ